MKCPSDGTDLTMTTREGVEIDYCPQCRGIWLDRGELDKLIERALRVEQSGRAAINESAPKAKRDAYDDDSDNSYERDRRPAPRTNDWDDDDYASQSGQGQPQKKRKGFLGDIFDIFD